jgi:VanZ family protein
MVRVRRWAALLLLCYWGLLFVGTHLPPGPLRHLGGKDKLMHVAGYAGLACLLAVEWMGGRPSWKKLWLVSAVVMVYAGLDEWSQRFVGRRSEWDDWYADLLGGAVGVLVYLLLLLAWRLALHWTRWSRPTARPAAESFRLP